MKKIILSVLSIWLCSFIIVYPAWQVDAETESIYHKSGDFEYTLLENGTAQITRYTIHSSQMVIPEIIDGYSVTSIGMIFSSSDESSPAELAVKEVCIPGSITDINQRAFLSLEDIESFSVAPANPIYQEMNGVIYTREGQRLVSFPRNWPEDSFTIPAGTTGIEPYAFCGTRLSDVTLPDGLLSIGEFAFWWTTSLQRVNIPDTVSFIGNRPFSNDQSLAIDIADNHPYFTLKDHSLIKKDGNVLVAYIGTSDKYLYTIPEGVETLGSLAFYIIRQFDTILVPSSVRTIEDRAICRCANLRHLYLQNGVTSLKGEWLAEEVWVAGSEEWVQIWIPETVIEIDSLPDVNKTQIFVQPGSYAEQFCQSNKYSYEYYDGYIESMERELTERTSAKMISIKPCTWQGLYYELSEDWMLDEDNSNRRVYVSENKTGTEARFVIEVHSLPREFSDTDLTEQFDLLVNTGDLRSRVYEYPVSERNGFSVARVFGKSYLDGADCYCIAEAMCSEDKLVLVCLSFFDDCSHLRYISNERILESIR